MKNLKLILLFTGFFFLLDYFLFGFLLWKIPNESPWGTNHFYNFEYERKRLLSQKSSKPLVLIIGSSIGYYSIDRTLLAGYLKEKTGKDYSVEYLSFAGMTPLDAYLFRNEILNLKPELVLYPINFIDFRLHRAYILNPENKNETVDDNIILQDALNWGEAPQSKFAFPFQSFLDLRNEIPIEKSAAYLFASLINSFRYREIYLPNLRHFFSHRFGRNTHYHGYAGVQIPERVSSLGWTGKRFTFSPRKYMFEKGFYLQVVPELVESGPLTITFSNREETVQKEIIARPGWIKLRLNADFKNKDFPITAELSKTWQPYQAKEDRHDYSRDELGVRLQQTFGLDSPLSDMHYEREERSEDLRYTNMSDSDYREYFNYRLLSDLQSRPGIGYIYALKWAKERLASENFRPSLHMKYLKKFADAMEEEKLSVLIINNPENPFSLEWYENSNWYKDHLDYLRNLGKGGCVNFVDYRNSLPMQDFSDFHHLTYPGMVKANSLYGELILNSGALEK